jgi:hypothetical protein
MSSYIALQVRNQTVPRIKVEKFMENNSKFENQRDSNTIDIYRYNFSIKNKPSINGDSFIDYYTGIHIFYEPFTGKYCLSFLTIHHIEGKKT